MALATIFRLPETRAGRLGLNYIRAKPYTPKNTGEAERLILREWAHAHAYNLPRWLHRYNWHPVAVRDS